MRATQRSVRVRKFRDVATSTVDDPEIRDTYRAADSFQTDVTQATEAVLSRWESVVTPALLREALRAGDNASEVVLRELRPVIHATAEGTLVTKAEETSLVDLEIKMMSAGATLSVSQAGGSLSMVDPFSVRAARANAHRFVVGLGTEARSVIRDATLRNVATQLTRQHQEQAIRSAITLSRPQHRAFLNVLTAAEAAARVDTWEDLTRTERELIRRTRNYRLLDHRLVDLKPGITSEQAERVISRYRERAIRHRAHTIARTETMRAMNAGKVAGMRSMVSDGVLNVVEKVWRTAWDERTCPRCAPLDGEIVGLDTDFRETVNGGIDGAPIVELPASRQTIADYPPLHTNCRCTITFRTR